MRWQLESCSVANIQSYTDSIVHQTIILLCSTILVWRFIYPFMYAFYECFMYLCFLLAYMCILYVWNRSDMTWTKCYTLRFTKSVLSTVVFLYHELSGDWRLCRCKIIAGYFQIHYQCDYMPQRTCFPTCKCSCLRQNFLVSSSSSAKKICCQNHRVLKPKNSAKSLH